MAFPSPLPLPRTCILDPMLALSPSGIRLVKQLGTLLDLWIAREFWPCLRQGALWPTMAAPTPPPEVIRTSAQAWLTLQTQMTPADLRLYWYGDRLWESHLPRDYPIATFHHWETVAQSLETFWPLDRWDSALLRDTLALAATLPHAFVLTCQPQADQPPDLCARMQAVRLPCRQLPAQDALVQMQRQTLQAWLLQAGLASVQWSNGRLAILQLGVGDGMAIPGLSTKRHNAASGMGAIAPEAPITAPSLTALWQTTEGFWYSL